MNNIKYISAFLILSIMSCGHVDSYLDMAKEKGISKTYINALNSWTRKASLYSQFETKLQITATFKSEDFNKAYRAEYARIYYLTAEETKRREELATGLSRDYREFLVYAAMPQKEANDFDKPNSSWSIFLSDEKGNQVKPLEVRKIDKIAPIMEGFYPYINKYYGICYSVKFLPLVAETKTSVAEPMKLVFTSVLGRVELVWP